MSGEREREVERERKNYFESIISVRERENG
jgi:hypothetical protein